jgi:hypothetical protein
MEIQNNTKVGITRFKTATDFTGKEGALVKLTATGAALPAAVTDICPFIVIRVNSATEAELQPFTGNSNFRVRLKGAVAMGGTLILGLGADVGKLAFAATGSINAIAEEAGVDGQLVLVRPVFRTL